MVACALATLMGCAHPATTKTCDVTASAFAAPYSEASVSYVVFPLNQGVDPKDPEFLEYKSYLTRALTARGYHAAESLESAELAVFLGYGVGSPDRHESSYHMLFAEHGLTPPDAATENHHGRKAAVLASSRDDEASSPPSDGAPPFTRYAIINAVDVPQYLLERRLTRVWSTRIVSIGHTADLRAMFPVILAGAWDLLGTNSRGPVRRRLEVNGAEVLWLKSAGR
jgi:hypothetical protein